MNRRRKKTWISSQSKSRTQLFWWRTKRTFTQSWQGPWHPEFMDTSTWKREYFSNFLVVSRRIQPMEFNWEATSTCVLSETQPQRNLNSSSTSASSCHVPSTVVVRPQMQQVWPLQCARIPRQVNSVSKLVPWCLLITESVVLMSSTKWMKKISLLSMKLWNNKHFL